MEPDTVAPLKWNQFVKKWKGYPKEEQQKAYWAQWRIVPPMNLEERRQEFARLYLMYAATSSTPASTPWAVGVPKAAVAADRYAWARGPTENIPLEKLSYRELRDVARKEGATDVQIKAASDGEQPQRQMETLITTLRTTRGREGASAQGPKELKK